MTLEKLEKVYADYFCFDDLRDYELDIMRELLKQDKKMQKEFCDALHRRLCDYAGKEEISAELAK